MSNGGGTNRTVKVTGALCADSLPAASTASTVTACVGPPGRRSVTLVVSLVSNNAPPS